MTDPLVSPLSPGQKRNGFEVRNVTSLSKPDMLACEFEHIKSGARVLHFHCSDRENLFSINFPTAPEDDTGLPHIMEHSVLSGSRRFPVRDPFFEMYKMSMATFINAMTGMDCTYYPVSSNVTRDLFNLAEVYFDAVFHPLLTRETFRREGYHVRPADPAHPLGPLSFNGIVYNEMKAAYSIPEARLWRTVSRELFPDTSYGRDSGGDPDCIPDLTYEQFMDFHRERYHPSNAYFVLYGDIPSGDYLEFLEPRLNDFSRSTPGSAVRAQPRWTQPRRSRDTYDIGDEPVSENTYLQVNWISAGIMDPETLILMKVLSLVLVGDDAAPLKRAIIDSGLGQDILPSGHMPIGLEGVFIVGIRGSEPDRLDDFLNLVLNELRKIHDEGIPAERIQSAFRKVSYELREIRPMRPLHVASEAISPWILGGDPLMYLNLEAQLERCRSACLDRPETLTELLREALLENPHRLDVTLAPDPDWNRRREARLQRRLGALRQAYSDGQMGELALQAKELEERAGIPNPPEAVASLPQLTRSDLPDSPDLIPTIDEPVTGRSFLRNDIFGNGINYVRIHINLDGLPDELWGALPYYLDTLNKLGAGKDDYASMARRISSATGSFHARAEFDEDRLDPSITRKGIVMGFKALDEQIPAALDVLEDKLFDPNPRDPVRFRDVLTQRKADMREKLLSGGPGLGIAHLMTGLTESGYLNERVDGLSHFRELRGITEAFDNHFERLVESVERIARFVLQRARYTFAFTGSDKSNDATRMRLRDWLGRMENGIVENASTGFEAYRHVPRCGLAGPMDVAHCVQIIPAVASSHPKAPLIEVGMALLRVDYMVNELRFKGNAYGASCSFPGDVITLSTYADPHIVRTLKVFAALPEYVRSAPWTETELTRAIISNAKNFIRPLRPESTTEAALLRHMIRSTDALRAQRYQGILSATPQEVKSVLLSVLKEGFPKAPVAVVAARGRLMAANEKLGDEALEIKDILN